MPQMAPLNWLTLMVYFVMIFLLLSFLNYYFYLPTMTFKSTSTSTIKNFWKW